jgi:hypothetical protein
MFDLVMISLRTRWISKRQGMGFWYGDDDLNAHMSICVEFTVGMVLFKITGHATPERWREAWKNLNFNETTFI